MFCFLFVKCLRPTPARAPFLSAFCSAIILIRDTKVHPSLTLIKVLALGSVVETLLGYTESSNRNSPRLAAGWVSSWKVVARGCDRGAGGQDPQHRPDEITQPVQGGGVSRALPASLATPAKSSELIPHTPC